MKEAKFKHYDLELINPDFGSTITNLILELEYLRRKPLIGSTDEGLFFQLKEIFHLLESLGSARIEGNNTTLSEYIETKIEGNENVSHPILEIQNIEKTMDFVDEVAKNNPINQAFIRELHRKIVHDLPWKGNGEGDQYPGRYREAECSISRSNHQPPSPNKINEYMEELLLFINRNDHPKYDLIKTAIVHHRFVWIHPFRNGNGRTVRMLTYAMLVKSGFNVNVGRILNPTAIFCVNRNDYYKYLGIADRGDPNSISTWCEYVLEGLQIEINKIDKLLDYDYLKSEILVPSIKDAYERKFINDKEYKILEKAVEIQVFTAGDIEEILNSKYGSSTSREINKLINKKIIKNKDGFKRKYVMNFINSYLLRSVMKQLKHKGFVSVPEKL